MIAELVHSRGLGIYIDGVTPANGDWGYGDDDEIDGIQAITISGGVQIGPHKLLALRYDVAMQEFEEGANPKELVLVTEAGRFVLRVTQVTNGEEEGDGEEKEITLAGGQVRSLDETQCYVRAES